MKISVISITLNNGIRLGDTFSSVYAQILPKGVEIEHIIVDGGNEGAGRLAINDAVARGSIHVKAEPKGCYNAINAGIAVATGDIISLVHGGDAYADSNVVARMIEPFSNPMLDFVYADIQYDSLSSYWSYSRYYSGAGFVRENLLEGFAPPHPSMFIRRRVMEEVGPYKEHYRSAADFDLFIRLFFGEKQYKSCYIPGAAVTMEPGGDSSRLINRLLLNTREKHRALRENGFKVSTFKLLSRYFLHFNFLKKIQQ